MKVFKDLAFVYIVNHKKFTSKKVAEKYAQQESKKQKAGKKKKEFSY